VQQSQADEQLTQHLKMALALVDIGVLDHFIVAGNQILSFKEADLI
jgi:DNA repair protein RadC